jgi:hypothetical protein
MSYYTGKKELQKMRKEILELSLKYNDQMRDDEVEYYNIAIAQAVKVLDKYIPHDCKIPYYIK